MVTLSGSKDCMLDHIGILECSLFTYIDHVNFNMEITCKVGKSGVEDWKSQSTCACNVSSMSQSWTKCKNFVKNNKIVVNKFINFQMIKTIVIILVFDYSWHYYFNVVNSRFLESRRSHNERGVTTYYSYTNQLVQSGSKWAGIKMT